MSQYRTINGESVQLGFADADDVDTNIIDHANGSHAEFSDGCWREYDIEGDLIQICSPGTPEFEKWQSIHRALLTEPSW